MLLHLVSQLSNSHALIKVRVLDLSIPELDLSLMASRDITAGRPYPNKGFYVVRRKQGTRAMHGFLIETDQRIDRFTMSTRWASELGGVYLHKVTFIVADDEFDAVSSDMTLWSSLRPFSPRGVSVQEQAGSPAEVQPRIDTAGTEKGGNYTDKWHGEDRLERCETFVVPTIEPARLTSPDALFWPRMPPLESAIQARVRNSY